MFIRHKDKLHLHRDQMENKHDLENSGSFPLVQLCGMCIVYSRALMVDVYPLMALFLC